MERGDSLREISRVLDRCPSTVSREVAANGGRGWYRAVTAHQRAGANALRPKPFKLVENPVLAEAVTGLLVDTKYSPRTTAKVVAGRGMKISHETIYRACYEKKRGLGPDVWKLLPRRRQKRKHAGRKWGVASGNLLGHPVSVHSRPVTVANRVEPGHLEGDLIIGSFNRSAVLTLVERVSRFTFLVALLGGYGAYEVALALIELLSRIPEQMRKTLTWDQGREMRQWVSVRTVTGTPIFFCDPHSPWQKPTVENNNGILRRWLPKGTDLTVHNQDDLDRISTLINEMPREIHNWQSAKHVYDHHVVATTT